MKKKSRAFNNTEFAFKTVLKYFSKILTYALSAIFTILIITIITGVVMASALAIYVKNYIDPTFDIPNLHNDIELTTFMYYYDRSDEAAVPEWREMGNDRLYASENRLWVSYDKVPTNLINAFIAIEDKRFRTHNGIDYRRTIGAILELAKGNTSYGGSTITQQLIKNTTQEDQATIQRKIQEIMRALDLEKRRSKEEILEMYLNTIYLSQGCHGVQSAANKYFGKDVSDLSLVECAAIASITQYPTKWDPKQNPENNRKRRLDVLDQMWKQHLITKEECDEASAEELVLAEKVEMSDETIHSYFVDQVIEDVINDLVNEKGYSNDIARHMVFAGGLKIYTTVDPRVQGILEEVYTERNEKYFPATTGAVIPQSAMVIMDPSNGDIVGLVGGRGEKSINRGLNRATQSKRQPGSSMKPIAVYAPAIDLGLLTYGSCVDDTPPIYLNGAPWPKNANRYYSGHVSLARAVAYSYNATAVRVYMQLGDDYVFDSLQNRFHISTLVDNLVLDSGRVLSDHNASLALGGLTYGVTVREMTAAYSVFANRGIYSKPRTYVKVLDKDNKLLLSNEGKQELAISSDTAAIITRLLQNVVDYGTGTRITLRNKVNVAGKTGSTTDNKDLYFCGYTPYYAAAIWYGYDIPRTVQIGSAANTVWNIVMDKVHEPIIKNAAAGKIPLKTFDENCSNLVEAYYCIDSGMKPGPYCKLDPRGSRTAVGWFSKDMMPDKTCTAHVAVRWDFTTGSVAGSNCPSSCCKTIGLVRENNRSFSSRVSVSDAQFMYRDLPSGYIYPSSATVPFFNNLLPSGTNAGSSGVARPTNSYCVEHNKPGVNINDILPDGTIRDPNAPVETPPVETPPVEQVPPSNTTPPSGSTPQSNNESSNPPAKIPPPIESVPVTSGQQTEE